ncbi:MAG: TrmH family RNA methyltransferase [Candidatus Omnitrophota bacterium]
MVSPQVPENIGLCARILKNTSFSNLYLVNPNLTKKSFEVARRAGDILSGAKIFTDLESAISDSAFVFGATRRRRAYQHIYNFNHILPLIASQAKRRKVRIVFGGENFGLSKEDLKFCDSVFYLPAEAKFPSYNLSAACAIVCHKIFEYLENVKDVDRIDLAKKKDIESLFVFIEDVIKKTQSDRMIINSAVVSLRRIFLRTHLTKSEVQLLKTIFLVVKGKMK